MRISRIFAHRVELPAYRGVLQVVRRQIRIGLRQYDRRRRNERGAGRLWRGLSARPFYLPAYAEGVRAGLREIGPHLLGFDPRELTKLNQRMDAALKGHPYVKSGIDLACWDLLGRATNLPVCTLLGGRFGQSVRLYRAISQQSPEEMAQKVKGYRQQGYTRFQLKVGGDPDLDIERIRAVRSLLEPTDRLVADANTGWTQHEAMRVVRAVRDVDPIQASVD